MPEPLWKKVQREHHRRMGGQGRTSYRYEDGPDSVPLPWLVVESKSVKELPLWLTSAVAGVVLDARPENEEALYRLNVIVHHTIPRLGIVRYHVTGTKYDEDVVVLRAKDFEDWFL